MVGRRAGGWRPQALNERKVEIRVQFKAPVSLPGSDVNLDQMRNELVMRLQPSEVRPRPPPTLQHSCQQPPRSCSMCWFTAAGLASSAQSQRAPC